MMDSIFRRFPKDLPNLKYSSIVIFGLKEQYIFDIVAKMKNCMIESVVRAIMEHLTFKTIQVILTIMNIECIDLSSESISPLALFLMDFGNMARNELFGICVRLFALRSFHRFEADV